MPCLSPGVFLGRFVTGLISFLNIACLRRTKTGAYRVELTVLPLFAHGQ